LIYIDDFEGATSSVDLRFPFISWHWHQHQAHFPKAGK
jgi:hypothetical protein